MRTKLSILIFMLVLALVLSACGTAAAQPRTLNVSGNGTV
jgi:ABC-type glycerol-3-phosphate transport system substrate-binding protein